MLIQQLRKQIEAFHHGKSGRSVIAVFDKAIYGKVILIADTKPLL